MLSSSSALRIQNLKRDKSVYLSIYPSGSAVPPPPPPTRPCVAFSIIFAFIRRSHAKQLTLMETEQIQIVLPPPALRCVAPAAFLLAGFAPRVRSTRVPSSEWRKAIVICFFNILSLRRSCEQAALAEQLNKPAVAPLGRTLLGWRMGKPGLSVAEALNYSYPPHPALPPFLSAVHPPRPAGTV